MKPLRSYIEPLSVYLILTLIFFPIRLGIVRYVSDNWFVSFGIMACVSITIIFLTKKNKLGWFGRALHKQMFKIHRGKRKYFVYSQVILSTLYFTIAIYGIHVGDTMIAEKQIIHEKIGEGNIKDFMEKSSNQIRPIDLPKGILTMFYIIIFRFDIFALIVSTINDMSDGYMLHIASVFLVEECELIGVLILTKLTIKQEQI